MLLVLGSAGVLFFSPPGAVLCLVSLLLSSSRHGRSCHACDGFKVIHFALTPKDEPVTSFTILFSTSNLQSLNNSPGPALTE